jgi:hypothetical protein
VKCGKHCYKLCASLVLSQWVVGKDVKKMAESLEYKLLAEQLGRMMDNINARLDKEEAALAHHVELDGERFKNLDQTLSRLASDHNLNSWWVVGRRWRCWHR